MSERQQLPEHTPIIVSAGQCVEFSATAQASGLSSPMDLAAGACTRALDDASVDASDVDAIAAIRLFSDTVKTWASPFGGSNNPPESIARRLGATPRYRLYSNAGGNEPVQVLMELLQGIARGEHGMALLCGAEAIGNQRYALKNDIELDWCEEFDAPLEDRQYLSRLASKEELNSGMTMPAHYYALIENAQAAAMGHSPEQHRAHMAALLCSFSAVAAQNPYAQFPTAYSAPEISTQSSSNYAISLPYTKRMIAQDAVNQSAALLLTSAGKAHELGIDPARWIVVEAYAQGEDHPVTQRENIARSQAMQGVIDSVLMQAGKAAADFDLIDIYSCFPCAVQAVCDVAGLPADGSVPLTVTGGLPYFGGPGNNYSMHALAEMTQRLRGGDGRALVTANGGQLSKHAAAVLRPAVHSGQIVDWGDTDVVNVTKDAITAVPYAANPVVGKVVSYTVVAGRDKADIGVIVGEDERGHRFLSSTTDGAMTADMSSASPIGRAVRVDCDGERKHFEFSQD